MITFNWFGAVYCVVHHANFINYVKNATDRLTEIGELLNEIKSLKGEIEILRAECSRLHASNVEYDKEQFDLRATIVALEKELKRKRKVKK